MINYYIYKTTNNINGKIYIGQRFSNRRDIEYLGSGKILKLAIKKYGKKNFTKEIIEICLTKSALDKREIYWIDFFDSRNRKIGYNITKGGGGTLGVKLVFTEEHKLNISKSKKGKTLTEEHKLSISKYHADISGDKNPMFGKTHTKEVKELLKTINIGKKYTKETKKKQSEQRKGEKNSNAKLNEKDVLKIRNDFSNNKKMIVEMAKEYNVNEPCISKIIHRRTWKHI